MWLHWTLLLAAMVADQTSSCKSSPELAGKCFVVHGRLRAYNGNPTFRIWPLGTDRLLGVTGPRPGETPIMPSDLGVSFDQDLFADFLVCPFTAEKSGVMRRVCIESATRRTPVPAPR